MYKHSKIIFGIFLSSMLAVTGLSMSTAAQAGEKVTGSRICVYLPFGSAFKVTVQNKTQDTTTSVEYKTSRRIAANVNDVINVTVDGSIHTNSHDYTVVATDGEASLSDHKIPLYATLKLTGTLNDVKTSMSLGDCTP